MSEEVLMHLSSNSNQSDPSLTSKLAKLEARMAGKGASSVQAPWPSVSSAPRAEGADDVPETSPSSDSDDDIVEEFLIQPNISKRPRFQEDEQVTGVPQAEAIDGRAKMLEAMDLQVSSNDGSRKKSTRGRGRSVTGRGRGPKACDQSRPQVSVSSMPLSNGHFENSSHKIGPEPSDALLLQAKTSSSAYNQENWLKERTSLQEEITLLKGKLASSEEEVSKFRHEVADHQALSRQLEKELKELKDQEQQMKPKRMKVLSDLLISVAKAERQESRTKIRQDSLRLGNVGVIRAGTIISESWEDGQTLKDIQSQLRNLWDAREAIERHRKSLKKRQSEKSDGSDHESGIPEEDFLIQDEICKSRLLSIKREEELLLKEKDRYELEKGRHIRELKRIRDEDGSRFNNFQILNHRYALLNLLGKGGFSEVYKAYDLLDYRYVACKMHGLNAQWSEEKKQSYIRHAIREYNIHKSLVHQHIVRLWDTFEIDHNTFCTVLEYCSGKDLDAVLKTTPILPEKEARIIIAQIFQGLVYLNRRPQKIIHYDLKPGNVIFDEVGVAKVTDFGLSKIVDDDVGSQGMELTSQGAGTYW
ncbi:unnamed protein product [Victoria cruziana]